MKKIVMMVIACLFSISIFAQEAVEVSGEYSYYVPDDMSLEEAKEKALVGAKNEAMAKKFGWLVISDDKLMMVDRNDKSDTYFTSYENSEVRGVWLKTIGKPVFKTFMDEETQGLCVKVQVKGLARERVAANIDLEAKLLRNETDKSESLSFVSEESFYLSFKSPVKGYLTVYLLDEEGNASCLLPYGGQEDGNMPIKANQPYIFFSEEMASEDCRSCVDEYFFVTEETVEHNRLCILFSPQLFVKAKDKEGVYKESAAFEVPREVDAQDFHEWLAKQKQMDAYLQVIEKDIEIRKEP